jgi:hypothetical protein
VKHQVATPVINVIKKEDPGDVPDLKVVQGLGDTKDAEVIEVHKGYKVQLEIQVLKE